MSDVELVPMSPEEFTTFIDELLPGYAASHVRNGRWTAEEAPAAARREVDELVPQGVATPGHHVFTVHAPSGGPRIGVLWVHVQRDRAFIYDVRIDEAYRRRGYGRGTMLAAESRARELGASSIALHVFGENDVARSLYRDLGYRETNVQMVKDLGPAGSAP